MGSQFHWWAGSILAVQLIATETLTVAFGAPQTVDEVLVFIEEQADVVVIAQTVGELFATVETLIDTHIISQAVVDSIHFHHTLPYTIVIPISKREFFVLPNEYLGSNLDENILVEIN